MVGFRLGYRLRHLVAQLREALGPDAEALPEIAQAVDHLEECINTDIPPYPRGEKRPLGGAPRAYLDRHEPAVLKGWKRLKNQLAHVRRMRQKAETSLAHLRQSKIREKNNSTTACFLARVALASPLQSTRAFAQSWQDLVGAGASCLGRTTIESIRNAFVAVVKDVYREEIRKAARRQIAPAPAPDSVPHAVVLHYQDEASLRLRSALDPTAPLSRARSSKVLQHVMWVKSSSEAPLLFAPTELCALANKSAPVLATSIFAELSRVAELLRSGFLDAGACARVDDTQKPRLVHVLIGDAIPTNEAAAKRILAWATRDLTGFQYFLIVIRFANHQVNLCLQGAVEGAAAQCTAGHGSIALLANPIEARRAKRADRPHDLVCAVVVRLVKYLTPPVL